MKNCNREIPFGVNGSEIKGGEYTIPEGFEAEIKDGKVIIREKESEDEGLRKGLISHLKELREWKVGAMSPIKVKEHYDAWITYLEKQKTSEEAIRYVKENHSPDEVSDFQAAMNIAVAKAYDKGVQDTLEKQKEQKQPSEDLEKAARKHNQHYLGSELSEEYIDQTNKRLNYDGND